MFKIKKTFDVAIAHKLNLSYESKCTKFHGHNLIVTVYCASEELDENNMVVDFTHIKKIVHDTIDHTSLSNIDCPECGHRIVEGSIQNKHNPDGEISPTAEQLAFLFCQKIPNCYRIDIQESSGNIATYIDDDKIE